MHMNELIQLPFGGPISIGYVDDITKEWRPLQSKDHNLILYGAADILAKLAMGNLDYVISAMYFEFTNGVVPTITNTDRSINVDYYTGLADPKSYIRSAIDSTPALSSSDDELFTANITTYFAATAGTTGENSVAFNQGAGSSVYGGALVATPTSDKADDIVFARFYFSTPVTKVNGSQIGIKWSVQFN